MLRAESVGSSRIEGLSAASRRLAKAEVALAQGGDPADQVAVEILGNIAAMESAIELATKSEAFGVEDLLAIHRTLMLRSSTPKLGGQIRQGQNWIGGRSYNPCRAAFVPPPPDRLDALTQPSPTPGVGRIQPDRVHFGPAYGRRKPDAASPDLSHLLTTMRNRLTPLALALLAACSSLPNGWVDPDSTTGEHDNFYQSPVADDGTPYQARWRGNDRAPERSLWRQSASGELAEQVTPWGPYSFFKVTQPGVVFAREKQTRAWTRFTESGATALALPDCIDAFDLTDSEGHLRHYMELRNPSRIALTNAMGETIRTVPGDRTVAEHDLLFVSLDGELADIVDYELNTITEAPLTAYITEDRVTIYTVPIDGHLRVAFGHTFANNKLFDELEPVRFPGSEYVAGWITREVGQDEYSLLSEILISRDVDHFVEIVELGEYADGYMGVAERRYKLIVVRVDATYEDKPFRVLDWSNAGKVLASSTSTLNLIAAATTELTLVRARAAQAENVKRQAEYDAYTAEKQRVEAAEREASAEAARRRRAAREIYLTALRGGGFTDDEIQRNERDGVPMMVVEGKAYAGRRLETWDDISYPGGIRWEQLPSGFTLWNDGARRWVGALMTQDRDGIRRALTFMGGYLDARPASYLEGLYVLPMSVAETLETCSACGGDGVETIIANVQRFVGFQGESWSVEEVKIGHSVSSGHWTTTESWSPNACPRCRGHGVTPY